MLHDPKSKDPFTNLRKKKKNKHTNKTKEKIHNSPKRENRVHPILMLTTTFPTQLFHIQNHTQNQYLLHTFP